MTTSNDERGDSTSTVPEVDDTAGSQGERGSKGSAGSRSGSGSKGGSTKLGDGRGDSSKGASRSPAKSAASAGSANERERRGPRRVRLTLARLDPFSVMKLSFLIAIAIGISTVVAVALLWNLVDAIGLWTQIDELGRSLNGDKPLPFMDFFSFSKMVSYGTVVAVINVVIITALGTLLAFLYNLVAALLGGLKLTFTDE